MAKAKFKKGNKFGKGRPPLSDDMKRLKKLTQTQVLTYVSKFGQLRKLDLQNHLQDQDLPIIELCFCKLWLEVLDKGDHTKLDFLLNRSIGKVKEVHEVSSQGGVMIVRPNGDKVFMGANPEEMSETLELEASEYRVED